jgi:hypothetical protein
MLAREAQEHINTPLTLTASCSAVLTSCLSAAAVGAGSTLAVIQPGQSPKPGTGKHPGGGGGVYKSVQKRRRGGGGSRFMGAGRGWGGVTKAWARDEYREEGCDRDVGGKGGGGWGQRVAMRVLRSDAGGALSRIHTGWY